MPHGIGRDRATKDYVAGSSDMIPAKHVRAFQFVMLQWKMLTKVDVFYVHFLMNE